MVLIRLCLILAALLTLSISAARAQSNPGWPPGYVPSAAEWANTWSSKRDYNTSIPACTWVPCQPAVGIVPNAVLQSTGAGGLIFGSTLPSGITIPNANLTGTTNVGGLSLLTPLPSASGGSGVASPAAHSLLISEGNFPFNLILPGTAGQIPISQGPTIDPAFKPISGDFTLSASGAGALAAIGLGGTCTYCTVTYDTKGRITSTSSGTVAGATPPGGTIGQVQYNNSGIFGGFTPSGACTVNVSTGVYTCFGTSSSALSFTNITGQTTLAQLPAISAGLLGNPSGTASPSLLTFTQATSDLNPCTSSLKGLVPSPPNNASAFLNGTCAWSVPSGAGNFSGPSSSTSGNLISFNGASGTLGQDSGINQANVITTTNSATLNANRLTGTLQAGQFPQLSGGVSNTAGSTNISLSNPSQTTLGGANSFSPQTNMFLTGLSTVGSFSAAPVNFTNLGGAATLAQLPQGTANSVFGSLNGTSNANIGIPTTCAGLNFVSATGFQCAFINPVNVMSLGADNTGTNDNASIINSAFSSGRTVLYFPAGTYKFNSTVTVNVSSAVTVVGDGKEITKLVFASGVNGLVFNMNAASQNVHVRDMSITTLGALSGAQPPNATGVEFNDTGPFNGQVVSSDITNVTFRGADRVEGADCWNNDFYNTYHSYINFINDDFLGCAGGVDSLGAGNGLVLGGGSQYGIVYNIVNANFAQHTTGLYYGENIQGVAIVNSNWTPDYYGVFSPPGAVGQDELEITNSQWGYDDFDILEETGISNTLVSNSLISGGYVTNPNGYINFMAASTYCSSCTFTGNSIGGYQSAPGAVGINITAGTCMIAGNVFNGWPTAINLGSGTSCTVQSNSYSGNTTNIISASSSSRITGNLPAYTSISNIDNNGSGLLRATVSSTAMFVSGEQVLVSPIPGLIPFTQVAPINVIDGTHVDLLTYSYTGPSTSVTSAISWLP